MTRRETGNPQLTEGWPDSSVRLKMQKIVYHGSVWRWYRLAITQINVALVMEEIRLSETPLTHCGIVPLNLTIQECRIVQQTDPLCSCHLLLSMCIVRKVTGTDPLNLTIQECRIVQQTDPLCSCHLVLSMCSVRKVTGTDILTLDGFVTGGPPFCCSIVPGRIAAVASQRQGRCSWGKHGGRGLRYTNSLHNEGGIVCVNANFVFSI
jgi:hypothetical protein